MAVFLLGNSSKVRECWFIRLAESGVDTVSYFMLVLFTRRERSQISLLLNIEFRATQMESTSGERSEVVLKII